MTVVPVSAEIAAESVAAVKALRDPADRLIVATSRMLHRPLLTHDKAMLRSRPVKRWVPSA